MSGRAPRYSTSEDADPLLRTRLSVGALFGMIRDLKLYQVGSNGTIDTFARLSELDFPHFCR